MNKTLLELKDISFGYSQNPPLLQHINIEVFPGEILSIIGSNGAGKSTLLKLIAGIYTPVSGEIIKNYTKISYVPQKMDIDMTFPVQVEEFINIYNPAAELSEVKKYFIAFDAISLMSKKTSDLSGGELQKVLIISALLSKPELVLLDEPTAGIDVIGEENFYKNIALVQKNFPKISIILVSHNLHLVYKNSDKVLCLHKNNFCCHGSTQDIKNNAQVQEIFGDLVRPYEHHPHNHHAHK